MPDTITDGGFVGGTYDVIIDGYAYTLATSDHDLPVSEAIANKADGTFKGGIAVKMQEKVSVKIDAIFGIPAPSQLVPFAFAFDGFPVKNWKVTNLKIASANNGAVIRTYTADITQYKNALPTS